MKLTPEQIDEAHERLDAALRRLSDPADIARRAVDPGYATTSFLNIRNLVFMLRESMALPEPEAGTTCGPCHQCHVRDEEPCPWGCRCHTYDASYYVGRPLRDPGFYRRRTEVR